MHFFMLCSLRLCCLTVDRLRLGNGVGCSLFTSPILFVMIAFWRHRSKIQKDLHLFIVKARLFYTQKMSKKTVRDCTKLNMKFFIFDLSQYIMSFSVVLVYYIYNVSKTTFCYLVRFFFNVRETIEILIWKMSTK